MTGGRFTSFCFVYPTRRGILVRNYVGVRRLYLSVADSKFTSAIVVGNVPSIYPVTFIPAMPRRRSPFRRVTPLPTQYQYTSIYSQASYDSVENAIPRNPTFLVCQDRPGGTMDCLSDSVTRYQSNRSFRKARVSGNFIGETRGQ